MNLFIFDRPFSHKHMPRTKEQFEEIRESRKKQIMSSALELFAKEGYGHVSISSLAKHAGISKGLMYNYFESKEQLLKEVLNNGVNEIIALFDPNHDGIITPDEVELLIRKTFQMMRENQVYWVRFLRVMIQPNVSEFLKEGDFARLMENYFGMFEAYFQERGFEDPILEIFHFSVLMEGFGMMMIYSDGMLTLPPGIFEKFEERIVKTYT